MEHIKPEPIRKRRMYGYVRSPKQVQTKQKEDLMVKHLGPFWKNEARAMSKKEWMKKLRPFN